LVSSQSSVRSIGYSSGSGRPVAGFASVQNSYNPLVEATKGGRERTTSFGHPAETCISSARFGIVRWEASL
jgi:hypothetical protein